MNYYIIPTKHMHVEIKLKYSDKPENYVSDSFMRNVGQLICQLDEFRLYYKTIASEKTLNTIYKINDVYSSIYDIMSPDILLYMPRHSFIEHNNLFFVMIEMYNTFDFVYSSINTFTPNIVYIGNNMSTFESSIQYIHRSPPGLDTLGMFSSTLDKAYIDLQENATPLPQLHGDNGFIFFDTDYHENNIKNSTNYTICLLKTLYIAMTTSKTCIIKVWEITLKPIIDIIYMLSGIYKNVYICKPTTTQHENDRYIICKGMSSFYKTIETKTKLKNKISSMIAHITNTCISKEKHLTSVCIRSVIENAISLHFINKIEESTLIVGQKNIEYYENLIIMFKLHGKEDKIDMAMKSSIMKCAQWCSKNSIPIKSAYTV